jgi:hypothetical protein
MSGSNFPTVLIYTLTLLMSAVLASKRGNKGIWQQMVREADFRGRVPGRDSEDDNGATVGSANEPLLKGGEGGKAGIPPV